jgi:hypothetical protein
MRPAHGLAALGAGARGALPSPLSANRVAPA